MLSRTLGEDQVTGFSAESVHVQTLGDDLWKRALLRSCPSEGIDPAPQRDGFAPEFLPARETTCIELSETILLTILMDLLTALDQDVEIVIRRKPRSRKADRISVVAA